MSLGRRANRTAPGLDVSTSCQLPAPTWCSSILASNFLILPLYLRRAPRRGGGVARSSAASSARRNTSRSSLRPWPSPPWPACVSTPRALSGAPAADARSTQRPTGTPRTRAARPAPSARLLLLGLVLVDIVEYALHLFVIKRLARVAELVRERLHALVELLDVLLLVRVFVILLLLRAEPASPTSPRAGLAPSRRELSLLSTGETPRAASPARGLKSLALRPARSRGDAAGLGFLLDAHGAVRHARKSIDGFREPGPRRPRDGATLRARDPAGIRVRPTRL